jgi:hypothetical protein
MKECRYIRLQRPGTRTIPICLKFTNFRATIHQTKVALKSIRIIANMVLNLPLKKTIPEFNKGAEKCDLNWSDFFLEFENVLQGHHKMAWKQVLHEHFPEPVNAMVPVLATQDCSLE